MHSISIFLLLVVLASCLNDVKAVTCVEQNNCQNGAQCVDNPGLNTHICVCTPQWTGDLCDYPIGTVSACSTNPCLNGGICSTLANGGFSCTCPPNFGGFLCEQTITISTTTPTIQNAYCLNGGICVNTPYTPPYYRCICQNGFAGTRCEYFTG